MANYSILQLNTLHGLSESGGVVYLALCDKLRNEKRAFWIASHYDSTIGCTLHHILHHSPVHALDSTDIEHLSEFFARRWLNNYCAEFA